MTLPPFVFKVDEMSPRPDVPPRIDPDSRDWRPPRPLYSNYISNEGVWFYHAETGRQLERVQVPANKSMPDNLNHFDTCSMYYSDGCFWIVPYDASKSPVGTGLQQEDVEARRPSGWSDISVESDPELGYVDWSPFSFRRLRNDTSLATIGAELSRLHVQHSDQDQWVTRLLPDRYHSPNRTNTPGSGGMVGDLPILIGLKAFSVAPVDVNSTLTYCVCGDRWPPHLQGQGLGWIDKRGLVIRTYTHTLNPQSTNELLEAFENGTNGAAYI